MKAPLCGLLLANIVWGVQTIYWKQLQHISAFEILGHRIIWGALCAILIVSCTNGWKQIFSAIKSVKAFSLIAANSFLLCLNWLVFLWAVHSDQIVAMSLGHFISPLIIIIFGCFIFKEKTTIGQRFAFSMALLAVVYQIICIGSLPWISIAVALVFSVFVLTKKMAKLDAINSLALDTIILVPFTSIIISFFQPNPFLSASHLDNIYLIGGGAITVIPMMLYAYGARKCGLKITGILQYISPTLSFFIGIFVYDEPFTSKNLITFILIWLGLIVCAIEPFLKLPTNSKPSKL